MIPPVLRRNVPALAALLFLTGSHLAPASPGHLVRLSPHAWAWLATDDRSSNSALFTGDSIALVVDPGLTPAVAREFLAAVRGVTRQPVRYAVLTHWHPDHALGVTCMRERTFTVVSSGKTRRRLAERGARIAAALAPEERGRASRAELASCRAAIPDSIVSGRQTFDLGGQVIEVANAGAAHTEGDLVVWSRGEQVLATGDLFLHQASPDMDEGHPAHWARVLDSLVALAPRAVVAGHFGPSRPADLARFRDYLHALVDRATRAFAAGTDPDSIPNRISLPEFQAFGQYPRYHATFAANAARVVEELRERGAPRGEMAGFRSLAEIDIGKNPHQIAFSADGRSAYVAVAGSDRVAVLDAATYALRDSVPVSGTPLGVFPGPDDKVLTVTRFRGDSIGRYRLGDHAPAGAAAAGGTGASLFAGPLPDGRYLVSVEGSDRLRVIDPSTGAVTASYPTGRRPFPPAATSDGRLAFVPNYDDGTVTVVDLWNRRVLDTVPVGVHPSGGSVLPGDIDYAVAVRGENRVLFLNTASHRVVDSLTDGIGESPFSVVAAPDGRLAFVNNTASHDISVIALPERRVVARIPVAEIPIVMAVHPSGKSLWVSSEGTHRLTVLEIPDRWRLAATAPDSGVTEVAVMGMIHDGHRTSVRWGLSQVAATIRRFRPDVVCTEIAPDRWDRIWSDYTERGTIEDPRVRRFPEYTGAILALSAELGFEIVPCAAWTSEMSDLRDARIRSFETEAAYAAPREEYARRLAALEAKYASQPADPDDPRVIHTSAYDERAREELALYDEYQNDLIGPGGWTNINVAHYRLIDRTLRAHRGRRVLITFGSSHKYWFLDHLRRDPAVRLIDLGPYLP